MLWKCCPQYASSGVFGKVSSGHRTGKGQFPFQSQRNAMPKNSQTTAQLHSSHTSKVMLKIIQIRLQQYMNQELSDVQAGFRKNPRRGTWDQIANIRCIIENAREFQKNICFIDYAKASVWMTTNCGKFFKRWECQTTLPLSWEICMVRKELDMEQWTGWKLGKEYIKRLYTVILLI